MSILDNLKPKEYHRVIDVVRDAGLDVSNWSDSKGGEKKAASNPKYRSEWAFVEPDKVVILNIWHTEMKEDNGAIVCDIDFHDRAFRDSKAIWKRRDLSAKEAILAALTDDLPIRVIVLEGAKRQKDDPEMKASEVYFRQLDPVPWTVTSYDEEAEKFRLTRGVLAERKEWSDVELSAAVSAYLEMLALEQQNKPYVKKTYNEALRQDALKNRTRASVEYRMQNISAVLEELCLPRINGYRPAKNIGKKSKEKIIQILESQGYLAAEVYKPVSDPTELDKRVDSIRKRFVSGEPQGNPKPGRTTTTGEAIIRDPLVVAWVLENAGELCECCDNPAPFRRFDGSPYLEVHHVHTLGKDGPDQISNAVAICPNCHRNLHFGLNGEELKNTLYKKIKRLVRKI